LNVFWDFRNKTRFIPYLGGGAGLAHYEVKNFDRVLAEYSDPVTFESLRYNSLTYSGFPQQGKARDNRFAWHLGAGLAFQINETVIVDLSYRYVDMASARVARPDDIIFKKISGNETAVFTLDPTKIYLNAHQVFLGLRVNIF
jgi:opacity protein-like surface antigen